MNKIINWTVGSLFRTLGRILCYLLIGGLIALALHSSDLKLPSFLKFFGVEEVYASTISPTTEWLWQECTYTESSCQWSSVGSLGSHYYTYSANSLYYKQGVVRTAFNFTANTQYKVTFRISSTPQLTSEINGGLSLLLLGATSSNGTYSSDYFNNITAITPSYLNNTNITEISIYFTPSVALTNIRFYLIYNSPIPNSYYNIRADSSFSTDTSSTDAINNQTNILINNQNQNTTDIINNNNENTDKIIDSNKSCVYIDKKDIEIKDKYLIANGGLGSWPNVTSITKYFKLDNTAILTKINNYGNAGVYACFYNDNKEVISCFVPNSISDGSNITIPNDAVYFRSTIQTDTGRPTYKLCKNGNQAINDFLNDDDTSNAENEAGSFFSDFTTNTHGLTGIITAPLNAIQSLTSATCSPLVLPLPFVNQNLTLPCMRSIYVQNFGAFMNIYDIITLGIVSYWIMVRIFALVKDFKNPDHDEIEVVDL